jgi:hypothetical protein
LGELSTDNPKLKGLNPALALGEMKKARYILARFSSRVEEFSAHYFKVKDLNPPA